MSTSPATPLAKAPDAIWPSGSPPGYERRRPEQGTLHKVVRENLQTLLSAAEQGFAGAPLPDFVRAELEDYLHCGLLQRGFALVACRDCGDRHLVAFSCRSRSFCPACMGRRMAATTLNLLAHVVPAAQEHVTFTDEGLVAIQLKKPFRDGTVSVEMDPLSLVSRLAAAVHPPRFHSIRYGGILAPHAKWRPFVIPPPTPEMAAPPPTEDASHSLPIAKNKNPRPATHRCGYVPWHVLLRQLGIDVETLGPARPAPAPRGFAAPVAALPGGFPPQICCRGAWQDEGHRAGAGPPRHRSLSALPGSAHGRAVHGPCSRATVLAEPRPAPPVWRAAGRGPSVGDADTAEATSFATRRRTGTTSVSRPRISPEGPGFSWEFGPVRPLGDTFRGWFTRLLPRSAGPEGFCSTYRHDIRAAAAYAPADRILVETDAPYLAPIPHRGQRNEPAYVVKTIEALAQVRGISISRASEATTANAFRLFNLGMPGVS